MLHVHPEQYSENPILFSLIYDILFYKIKGAYFYGREKACALIQLHMCKNRVKQHPHARDDEKISHDNMTAILIFSYIYDLTYHKVDNGYLWHPRDSIFYSILQGNDCTKVLKPALKVMCKHSIAKKWKIRPNPWEKAELYWRKFTGDISVIDDVVLGDDGEYTIYYQQKSKTELGIWERRLIHSDGKILWWLRQLVVPLGVKIDIVKYLQIYFKHHKHPIHELISYLSSGSFDLESSVLDKARIL